MGHATKIVSFAGSLFLAGILLTGPSLGGPVPISDGVTPTYDPVADIFVVLPEGAPAIIVHVPNNNVTDPASPREPINYQIFPGGASGSTCVRYHAGYIQNRASIYNENTGASAYITTANLPLANLGYICNSADGVSYWVLQDFSNGDYIQAGWSVYRSNPSVAKAFCERNSLGFLDAHDQLPNFGNGVRKFFMIVKGSDGNWRAYYADPGGVTVDMGCSLGGHSTSDGFGAEYFGEVGPTTSKTTQMGPMTFDTLRVKVLTQWRVPTQIEAIQEAAPPSSPPCPPYGAGPISGSQISPGTNRQCLSGVFQYNG